MKLFPKVTNKIRGKSVKTIKTNNIPWENRPAGSDELMWRYSANPIITKSAVPGANTIFNSAVVPFEDAYVGVFRVDNNRGNYCLHVGRSEDGINWKIETEPISIDAVNQEIDTKGKGYDPRVCEIDGKYYVTWCNNYHGPTIGVAETTDFKSFTQRENAFLPYNRNGVMFPKKINGKFAMLSRPSDNGHTPFGDIFYSESPDLCHWGCHRWVMGPRFKWQWLKIGAGPIPIETEEGWLLIYHGVLQSCNGYIYKASVAVLDADEPWKIKYHPAPYTLAPEKDYERIGDVGNVVFPCAALRDDNRLAIYYGAADTVVALAFAYVDELLEFAKKNHE